jgi:hypothetical protein
MVKRRNIFFIVIVIILTSCCRPATQYQVIKWERRHKFESPNRFWGLHIFNRRK